MEVNLAVNAHPVEHRGQLGAEAGFSYGRGRIALRVGEDAVCVYLRASVFNGVADLDIRRELSVRSGAGAGPHLAPYGAALDRHFRHLPAAGCRVYRDPGLGLPAVFRAGRIV